MTPPNGWRGPDDELGCYIAKVSQSMLNAYREAPDFVTEHANLERDTAQGGYRHRQLFELVQNGADALSPVSEAGGAATRPAPVPSAGRIEVWLVDDCLYCADNGSPIDEAGVRALMFSHMSPKRATAQIGTFGLGFKSLLTVSDAPEFYSRSGSFCFDRERARKRISEVVPDAERYPVLRVADPIDPRECRGSETGRELMKWASNIVRLPLKPDAYRDLHKQLKDFPAEFLLFVKHVRKLRLTDDSPVLNRVLQLSAADGAWKLRDDDRESSWKLFEALCVLSPDASGDGWHGDSLDSVPLMWASPLDRLDLPGKFWAYFPTETPSLVAGILNAPWKTNQDRQNLLPGPFNDELIRAAARLIADNLPEMATEEDPARHLDALPRRHEEGDPWQVDLLRDHLFSTIRRRPILPDQDGRLKRRDELSYPPSVLASSPRQAEEARDLWASHEARPADWLHHRALTRNRMARVNVLFESDPESALNAAPRTPVGRWLEALVAASRARDPVGASKAALRIAALLDQTRSQPADLGEILLTANRAWRQPDPERIFLPYESPTVGVTIDPRSCVHSELAADRDTLQALRKLGFKEQTHENRFRMLARRVLQGGGAPVRDVERREFWISSRRNYPRTALGVIKEFLTPRSRDSRGGLGVLTRSGTWAAPHSVLLPGSIVPGDGSRDDSATVDMGFHGPDRELLTALGVAAGPQNRRDLSNEMCFGWYRDACEQRYRSNDSLRRQPQRGKLDFTSHVGAGPLQVLMLLSEEGKAFYTDALLRMDECYESLEMWHTGSNRGEYPKEKLDSLAVHMIREHGRIRTADGIVPFADALGENPVNTDALLWLLRHPKANRIRDAFGLADPAPELIGLQYPVPLVDVWPGLHDHLPSNPELMQLVRCEGIRVGYDDRSCLADGLNVYLAADSDEEELEGLRLVARALQINLGEAVLWDIARGTTPAEVEDRRAQIRQHATDARRLLAAVGEDALRAELPGSLLDALESDSTGQLAGTDIAEAAIATYHTDALRQYRHRLDDLKPPTQWAGSAQAVNFVRSLGFSEEWAGAPSLRPAPYEVVDGPLNLPDLHDYQRTVVENVRRLIRASPHRSGRRGMLSMPTGSGKTRVAVQSIVEAIRDDGFRGGVLWIADRDELCEQAVEAWRQVWASIGGQATQLRISRMWRGQPRPLPTSELHVVVATIQTTHSRISSPGYDFLRGFRLVVFDEAHRSIAPTATTVFRELGLTFRTSSEEPFLIGLTATPYRGHDERETERLVNRYGQHRLDAGAFEDDAPQAVIEELQRTGVLAQADHDVIDGGTFELSAEELSKMQRFARGAAESDGSLRRAWLPPSAEDRIARNTERTRRIIDAFSTHIQPDWPTLIFATSVEHAQTVSALLNRRGIAARAVSGKTEHAARRRVVEQFRGGEIQALVNYAVFREGFDAPRTRAIIVARPVYSPNLYFQMIGRGLRGPKNGGNDRCLILNVYDNIENFGRELAFSDLDWLWTP